MNKTKERGVSEKRNERRYGEHKRSWDRLSYFYKKRREELRLEKRI